MNIGLQELIICLQSLHDRQNHHEPIINSKEKYLKFRMHLRRKNENANRSYYAALLLCSGTGTIEVIWIHSFLS